MSRNDYDEEERMNPIQRDRYERRMATRRKSMVTNIIVGAVILAIVVAIIVVAVNLINKPKSGDTDPSATAATTATVAQTATAAPSTTATQQPSQSGAGTQNNQGISQQETQSVYQNSTDVQLPTQTGETTGGYTTEIINGERVNKDNKHKAPETTGSAYHYYLSGGTSNGYDWNYDADNGNFVLACDYNFDKQQYDFIFYGAAPGTANVNIYYYTADNVMQTASVTVNVDDNLNVTVG